MSDKKTKQELKIIFNYIFHGLKNNKKWIQYAYQLWKVVLGEEKSCPSFSKQNSSIFISSLSETMWC